MRESKEQERRWGGVETTYAHRLVVWLYTIQCRIQDSSINLEITPHFYSHTHSPSSQIQHFNLLPLSPLPLPLLKPPNTIPNPKPVLQQTSNILQSQPRRLRINPPDHNLSNHTNPRIQCKSTHWAENIHHGQKGNPDKSVRPPVRSRRHGRTQRTNGKREEFGLLPRDVSHAYSVAGDVGYH